MATSLLEWSNELTDFSQVGANWHLTFCSSLDQLRGEWTTSTMRPSRLVWPKPSDYAQNCNFAIGM